MFSISAQNCPEITFKIYKTIDLQSFYKVFPLTLSDWFMPSFFILWSLIWIFITKKRINSKVILITIFMIHWWIKIDINFKQENKKLLGACLVKQLRIGISSQTFL